MQSDFVVWAHIQTYIGFCNLRLRTAQKL